MKANIGRKAFYYGIGGGAFFICLALAYVSFWQPNQAPIPVGENRFLNVALKKGIEDCATYTKDPNGGPEAYLCVKDNRQLVISWNNLPRGTENIRLYRSENGEGALTLWQTVMTTGTSGELVLMESSGVSSIQEMFPGIGADGYYMEAVGSQGEILYTSATSTPETAPEPTPVSNPSSSETTGTEPPTEPAPPPASQAPSSTPANHPQTPSSTASTTAQPPSPPPSSSTTLYYYTPDGQVSSSGPPPVQKNFWVQHVNKKIEIGWNSLPSGTNRIVVSRAQSGDGPWSELLAQNDPVTSSYFVRLVDNTMGETFYYKLDALQGAELLMTYGPELLPPLNE